MVRIWPHRLAFLLFIASGCFQSTFAQAGNTVISGRVTDSNGQPVANASVSLYSQTRIVGQMQSVDRVIPVFDTDLDGKFRFSHPLHSNDQLTLYVMTQLPAQSEVPLRPPFLDLTGARLFPGVQIQVDGRSEIEVGDIPIQIVYKPVIVHLREASGMNVLKTGGARLLWLRVRDLHGDVVVSETVTEKAINDEKSLIRLALPQGRWSIDVSLDGQDGPWSSVAKPLQIDAMVSDFSVSLTFTERTKDHSTQRDSTTDQLRTQEALKRLAELGIHYDATSFVEHAGKCNGEAVRLFLLTDMSLNVRGVDGTTALLMAAARGCADVTKSLLDAGADPNTPNDAGTTAIIAAAGSGSLSTVKALLAKYADTNAQDKQGLTSVIIAVGNSHLEILNALLRASADVNKKDVKGMTALDYAMETGDRNVLQVLRAAGAKSGRQ